MHGYWHNILSAKRSFGPVPQSRWDHSGFFDPDNLRSLHRAYSDQGAFVDNVEQFAAQHYRLPPSRVHTMDPQHRLLLDAARTAWIDAGFERRNVDRSSIGVFVGMSAADYRELSTLRLRTQLLIDGSLQQQRAEPDLARAVAARGLTVRPFHALTMPGCLQSMGPALVSSELNLGGPSFAVDAACSSSLVALHQAVAALRSGQCSAALVGGVYLSLVPDAMVAFSRIGALSRSGVCRPFDGNADGFVIGEGAGMVVIKPLNAALADGDDIYAIIRGSGSSNDGKAEGPMTPTAGGQLIAMRRAYEDADSDPADLVAIEAHGTATTVGDRTEIESLARLRQLGSSMRCEATVTSVKALIGHTMAAAGIASIVKAALMARHRVIPGQPELISSAHTDSLGEGRLALSSRTVTSKGSDFGLIGLSSFGFGGTNVHVVLEPPSNSLTRQLPKRSALTEVKSTSRQTEEQPYLLVFSAANMFLLVEHLKSVCAVLTAHITQPTVPALARTLSSRSLADARLAIICRTIAELKASLELALERISAGATGVITPDIHVGERLEEDARRIAFIFPGQGSQSPHMQADLYARFPAFRDMASMLNAHVLEHAGVNPLAVVLAENADSDSGIEKLKSTNICQPALAVMGLASVAMLREVGIHPDLVLGHSVGELAAAATAGALSKSDAVMLAAIRGHHMNLTTTRSAGGMIALGCDAASTMELLDGIEGAWPAAYNDPRQTVVSATPQALRLIADRSEDAGIPAQMLRVANGFHSPLLEPIRHALEQDLAHFSPITPTLPLISTVTGQAVHSGEMLREHLVNSVFDPVRFSTAIDSARKAGARVFIQIGGGNALLSSLRRCLSDDNHTHIVASSASSPDEATSFLRMIAQVTVLGVDPELSVLVPRGTEGVRLPIAPLPTQRYWVLQPAAIGEATDHGHVSSASTVIASPKNSSISDPGCEYEENGQLMSENIPPPSSFDARNQPLIATASALVPSTRNEDHLSDLLALMNRQLGLIEATRFAPPTASTPRVDAPAKQLPPAQGAHRVPPVAATTLDPTLSVETATEIPQIMHRRSEVETIILDTIAKISGYPLDLIRADMHLVDSLGFDSLMVRELVARIHDIWPSLPSPPELGERFAHHPIVGEIVGYIGATLYPGVIGNAPAIEPEAVLDGDAPTVASPSTHNPADSVHEDPRIENFPEAVALRQRRLQTDRNPYFLLHEGLINDTTTIGDRQLVSFSSYNYLGFSGHPAVAKAISDAVTRYGSSVSASRFLSGERPIHAELEKEMAALLQVEAALVLVSGHATNVSVIGHVVGPGDLIVHDEFAHDSIIQGAKLSGATRRSFRHNDVTSLDQLLSTIRSGFRRVLIVVEGVYSMDGDLAPLPELIEVKKRHSTLLLIDEAHSIGTVGARGGGLGEHFGVDRADIDLWSGTMSKSLSGCGGYIGGTAAAIEYLKYSLPGFVYSVGITPANTAASLAALRLMRAEPERLVRLRENGDLFRELARERGINIGDSRDSPVVPCIVGSSGQALALATALFDAGYSVNPILYPAVPDDQARLRFFLTAEHTDDQIRQVVELTAQELNRITHETEDTV